MSKVITSPVSWDKFYMQLAMSACQRSKDPRTKVGACVVDEAHHVQIGYNGFPKGVLDSVERWTTDEKYELVIHAEMNAIMLAEGLKLRGSTLYATLLPCSRCAIHVIQCGIAKVVYLNEPTSEATKKACSRTLLLFEETGVELVKFSEYEEVRG